MPPGALSWLAAPPEGDEGALCCVAAPPAAPPSWPPPMPCALAKPVPAISAAVATVIIKRLFMEIPPQEVCTARATTKGGWRCSSVLMVPSLLFDEPPINAVCYAKPQLGNACKTKGRRYRRPSTSKQRPGMFFEVRLS